MERKYFTIAQANKMLPKVKARLARIKQMRAQAQVISRYLEEAGCMPDRETFEIPEDELTVDVLDEVTSLKLLADEINKDVTDLITSGAIIKDLDKGLVDWYAKKDDRDIFLCWMIGDDKIKYWHEIDTGFRGRKPVSEI